MPAAEIEGTPAPIGKIARTYGRLKLLRASAISAAAVICAARTMAPTEIHDYAGLVAALRARKEALDVSFSLLEHLSGLQNGYISKLLSPRPSKRLGQLSLDCLLAVLGLKLVVQEDPEAMAKLSGRLTPRYRRGDAHHAVHHARHPRPAAPVNGHAA